MNVMIICNTVYQVFVASWLKFTELQNDSVDIFVSDHMNDSEKIVENIKKCKIFNEAYHMKTRDFVYNYKLSRSERFTCIINSYYLLKKHIKITKKYDAIYVANFDQFAKLTYHTIANDVFAPCHNKKIKIYLYEDGMSTYSKLFEWQYNKTKIYQRRTKPFYKPKSIYGNLSGIYLFDKNAIMWQPDTKIIKIPKIDVSDFSFKNTINTIFGYIDSTDVYDKKYIFMEESFYHESGYMEDIELIEKISKTVGKENFMVKIHPRNPVNRFEQLGYKTNKNTAIPWEVILLNNDFSDKILLTVASSSVMASKFLFDQNIKTFVMLNCLNEKPKSLKGPLWDCSKKRFALCSNIKLINSVEEILTGKETEDLNGGI